MTYTPDEVEEYIDKLYDKMQRLEDSIPDKGTLHYIVDYINITNKRLLELEDTTDLDLRLYSLERRWAKQAKDDLTVAIITCVGVFVIVAFWVYLKWGGD